MTTRLRTLSAVAIAAMLAAGCAGDTSSFFGGETASVAPPAPKVDPTCVALTSKIEELRKDGVAQRMEKASTGKSSTVSVKRASIAKMTELDKLNTEFQTKCSTLTPRQQTAKVPAAAAAAAAPAVKKEATAVAQQKVTAAAAAAAPAAKAAQ